MALNSVVTPDGAEIGRAQAVQAAAAGVEPEAAMNPILIKPSGDRHSQVVVMGRPYADADARSYQALKDELRPIVLEALADLRERFDVVVCEGAGSPAEINLRAADLDEHGPRPRRRPAGAASSADIDRGGVFASLFGTLALLDADDQAPRRRLRDQQVPRRRRRSSRPALDAARASCTGRPTLGVLPYVEDLWMDVEDSLALEAAAPRRRPTGDTLDVAVLRLRWMSNFTDVDALARRARRAGALHALAGRRRARRPRRRARARRRPSRTSSGCAPTGSTARSRARAAAGAPILGICGGYQLLGERIDDEVESGRGAVAGLGLLPVTHARSRADKVLRRRTGRSPGSATRRRRLRDPPRPRRAPRRRAAARDRRRRADGCVPAACSAPRGTALLEHDAFRRALLALGRRARAAGASRPAPTPFAAARERAPRRARRPGRATTSTPTRLRALIEARRRRPACPTIAARRCRRAALRDDRRHRDPRHRRAPSQRLPDDFPEVRCANPAATPTRGVRRRRARRRARRARAGCSAAGAAGRRASTCCATRCARDAASRCSRSAARPSPTPR